MMFLSSSFFLFFLCSSPGVFRFVSSFAGLRFRLSFFFFSRLRQTRGPTHQLASPDAGDERRRRGSTVDRQPYPWAIGPRAQYERGAADGEIRRGIAELGWRSTEACGLGALRKSQAEICTQQRR
ncbi:hypothetical protein GGI35DRAFT_200381 [Trichoderma velutinum]